MKKKPDKYQDCFNETSHFRPKRRLKQLEHKKERRALKEEVKGLLLADASLP